MPLCGYLGFGLQPWTYDRRPPQAILRVFYLAVLHREVAAAASCWPAVQRPVTPQMLLHDAVFIQQLAFVLRPLLARAELLLCLVRGQQPPPPPPPLPAGASDSMETVCGPHCNAECRVPLNLNPRP